MASWGVGRGGGGTVKEEESFPGTGTGHDPVLGNGAVEGGGVGGWRKDHVLSMDKWDSRAAPFWRGLLGGSFPRCVKIGLFASSELTTSTFGPLGSDSCSRSLMQCREP